MITPAVSKRFHQSSATEMLRDKLDNVMVKETEVEMDLICTETFLQRHIL